MPCGACLVQNERLSSPKNTNDGVRECCNESGIVQKCEAKAEIVHEKNGIESIPEIAKKLVVPTVKCASHGKSTAPSTDPSDGSQGAIAHRNNMIWSVANERN